MRNNAVPSTVHDTDDYDAGDSLVLDLEEYDFDDDTATAATSDVTTNVSLKRTRSVSSSSSLVGDIDQIRSAKKLRTEPPSSSSSSIDEARDPCLSSDDDDDDDDDGVNVIIDLPNATATNNDKNDDETSRLRSVLADDPYRMRDVHGASRPPYRSRPRDTPSSPVLHPALAPPTYQTELQLKNEIQGLVAASVHASYRRAVTLLVDNKLVVVPDHVPLSDQLSARIWPPDKLYCESKLPYLELFNSMLIPNAKRRGDTYAVFSVKYNRARCALQRPTSTETRSAKLAESVAHGMHHSTQSLDVSLFDDRRGDDTADDDVNNVSALYHFCDFAAIVVTDNKVVDYAVHGVRSSIIRMLDAHRPRRVYYNARVGDPLDVFVNYRYQPFYAALQGISRPVKMNRNRANFNTIAFCERTDVFCALCCCLRDLKVFANDADVPNTVRVPRPIKFISWLPYDPYKRTSVSALRSRAMNAAARRLRQQAVARNHQQTKTSRDTESPERVKAGDDQSSQSMPVDDPFRQPERLPRRHANRFPRSGPQRYRAAKESLRDKRRGDYRPMVRTPRAKRSSNR